jgi:hypothetical protein
MRAEFMPEVMEMVLLNRGLSPEEVEQRMAEYRAEAALDGPSNRGVTRRRSRANVSAPSRGLLSRDQSYL